MADAPQVRFTAKGQKLIAEARPALPPGETVLDVTTGQVPVRRMGENSRRNGTVLVTDRRVVLFSKKLGGYEVWDFAYGLLTGVDHKKGRAFGDLTLRGSGDAAHVRMVPAADVERVAQRIRDRMALTTREAPPAPSRDDPIEQLRRLGELRDAGFVTPDEFEAKKADLLARM